MDQTAQDVSAGADVNVEVSLGARPRGLTSAGVLPKIDVVRWATLVFGILLAFGSADINLAYLFGATILLMVNTIGRALHPLILERPSLWTASRMSGDLAVAVAGVALTGQWESPYALTPVAPLFVIGYALGTGPALLSAAVASAFIASIDSYEHSAAHALGPSAQLAVVLLFSGILGAYTRHLVRAAEDRQSESTLRFTQLTEANKLLTSLHQVAQALPSSLDLPEVIAATQVQLHRQFDFTCASLMILDSATGEWKVELSEGTRLAETYATTDLPGTALQTVSKSRAGVIEDLVRDEVTGCAQGSRSALTAPLRATDSLVGILILEHSDAGHFAARDAVILDALVEPLAYAIENALLFSRLRALGAEAERARIARDLHDHLAQSLAYVSLELARLAGHSANPDELLALRDDISNVLAELRETLFQLRTTVTEASDLRTVAEHFLQRFQERTGIDVTFASRIDSRPPIAIEKEFLRIMQEALVNVERHAHASRVWVTWSTSKGRSWLEVRDNGSGFESHQVGSDRYGLIGMRERANAISGSLSIESSPKSGTRIVVEAKVAS